MTLVLLSLPHPPVITSFPCVEYHVWADDSHMYVSDWPWSWASYLTSSLGQAPNLMGEVEVAAVARTHSFGSLLSLLIG